MITPPTRMQTRGCRLHGSVGAGFCTSTPFTVAIVLQPAIAAQTAPANPTLPARQTFSIAHLLAGNLRIAPPEVCGAPATHITSARPSFAGSGARNPAAHPVSGLARGRARGSDGRGP